MKNRNEQPSAKQNATQNLHNSSNQNMKNNAENRVESCNKHKDMKNNVNAARNEMRTENNRVENNHMKNTRKEQ